MHLLAMLEDDQRSQTPHDKADRLANSNKANRIRTKSLAMLFWFSCFSWLSRVYDRSSNNLPSWQKLDDRLRSRCDCFSALRYYISPPLQSASKLSSAAFTPTEHTATPSSKKQPGPCLTHQTPFDRAYVRLGH